MPHHHRRADDDNVMPPAPMTSEQLNWITEQIERAVDKAIDKADEMDRRRTRHRLIGFAVLFVAFLGNVLYSNHISDEGRHAVIRSGDILAVDGCNRDFQDRQAVRGVLIASKDFTEQAVKRGSISEEEAKVRLEFYNQRLEELPLPDCRKADDILTDDPNESVTVPTPLYPQNTTERLVDPQRPRPERP